MANSRCGTRSSVSSLTGRLCPSGDWHQMLPPFKVEGCKGHSVTVSAGLPVGKPRTGSVAFVPSQHLKQACPVDAWPKAGCHSRPVPASRAAGTLVPTSQQALGRLCACALLRSGVASSSLRWELWGQPRFPAFLGLLRLGR